MRAAIPLFLTFVLSAPGAIAQSAGETGNATSSASPAGAHIDSVEVNAGKIPLEPSIHSFVKSYVVPTIKAGKIAKWARSICPISLGLKAEFNLAVTARIRQVAAQVGAPFNAQDPCDPNVRIIFTSTPQEVLDDMAKNHQEMLGFHDVSQIKAVTTISHPIQAWYATETRDNNGTLHLDSEEHPFCSDAIATNDLAEGRRITPQGEIVYTQQAINNYAQKMYQYCGGARVTGNRLNDGMRSEFNNVTIIADFNKLRDLGISSIANYIAMLVLSQTEAFETCQEISTITNVMTPNCDANRKPNTLSQSDLAYLTALYKMNPDNMLDAQITEISHRMEDALQGH
jgi:hypothetical protein